MSAVIGFLVVIALLWFMYARSTKAIASRRYRWTRRQAPNLQAFWQESDISTRDCAEEIQGPSSDA